MKTFKTYSKGSILLMILEYLSKKQEKTTQYIINADYDDDDQRQKAQQLLGGDHAINDLVKYLDKKLVFFEEE